MPIGILNNIASLAAENQLTVTNNNLQNVLLQLSSGDRINSGADDPAGLAIANGLQANVTALTQSEQNVNDGTGELQVADGALSQVTTLLNRAVTLATESATGTVSDSQRVALQSEFSQITAEINQIGSNTTFNGAPIFSGGTTNNNQLVTGGQPPVSLASAASGQLSIYSGSNLVYTTSASDTTVGDVVNDINSSDTGLVASLNSNGQLMITDTLNRGSSTTPLTADAITGDFYMGAAAATNYNQATATGGSAYTDNTAIATPTSFSVKENGNTLFTGSAADTTVGALIADINSSTATSGLAASLQDGKLVVNDTLNRGTEAEPLTVVEADDIGGAAPTLANGTGTVTGVFNPANSSTMNIFLSDSTVAGSAEIGVTLGSFSSDNMNGVSLASDNLSTQSAAQTALIDINNAISQVAALRGQIGASTERLQSAANVISSQSQNLTSAEDNIMEADIPTAVANLTNYSILEQTGISALAQANQQQQLVLKLLQ